MVREREEWGMWAGGKETAAGDGREQEAPRSSAHACFPPWTSMDQRAPRDQTSDHQKNGGDRICETTVSPMVARFQQDLASSRKRLNKTLGRMIGRQTRHIFETNACVFIPVATQTEENQY